VQYSTSLKSEIIRELKHTAIEENKSANEIIEEALEKEFQRLKEGKE
jgi:hypothetical protein